MAFANISWPLPAAPALLGIVATVALAGPLQGQVTEAYDDGLLVTGLPIASEPSHGRLANGGHWLKVETDSCGFPEQVQNRQSFLTQSSLDDNMEDLDDLDPADEAWALIAMSLSAHSDIAVISDGVGKTCDDSPLEDEDSGAESIAGWHGDVLPGERSGGGRRWSGPAPYIA